MQIEDTWDTKRLFGSFDENIFTLESEFSVKLVVRDGEIRVFGDAENADLAVRTLRGMSLLLVGKEEIDGQTVRCVAAMVREGDEAQIPTLARDCLCVTAKGSSVKPKTPGQYAYARAIEENIVTIGAGPAGTGKTYLAVAMAVTALRAKQVGRIVLTRPAVEAGERLGFLPGDLQQKVNPYLRPLYDALFDMFGAEGYQKQLERGVVEVAPLAYMRGRTLDDAFIILDEAQNTTKEQMKMFLTRLGSGSRMVVNGDLTQTDLPRGQISGLAHAVRILRDVPEIAIVRFTKKDVVRHRLVQNILAAYEQEKKSAVKPRDP
jgi:phosphate starvation-inducible PhoH-like protein